MKLIFILSAIIILFATSVTAQNVMTLRKIVRTETTYRSTRSVVPTTTMVTTGFEFLINGVEKGDVGGRYKNLYPYFKDCPQATNYLDRTRRKDRLENYSKIGGGVLFLVGGAMLFTGKENHTPGIVVLSIAGIAEIYGLVQQGSGTRMLRKAVAAYNSCENEKKKTGLLKQLVPYNMALASFSVPKPILGVQLNWLIGR